MDSVAHQQTDTPRLAPLTQASTLLTSRESRDHPKVALELRCGEISASGPFILVPHEPCVAFAPAANQYAVPLAQERAAGARTRGEGGAHT